MAKRADITPELCRQLLRYDPETGKLYWRGRPREMFCDQRSFRTWNARFTDREAFTNQLAKGYLQGEIFHLPFYAHRVAWAVYFGAWPKDQIDHINGNKSDNRILNLREATHSENLRNCGLDARNTSGVNGVFCNSANGRWTARIRHEGRYIHLGSFRDKEEAVRARRQADMKYGYAPGHGLPRATVT